MLPERIKYLLDSYDMDLVRLGAQMMQKLTPKEKWEKILEAFSYADVPNQLWIKKWTFKIEGDEITITPTTNIGVIDMWAMRQKVDSPLLTLNTVTPMKIENIGGQFQWSIPAY